MKKVFVLLFTFLSLPSFADVRISNLPAIARGSETTSDVVPIVSGSTTYKLKTTDILPYGTNTNDSAAAGYVGEYFSGATTTFTNFPGATGAWGDDSHTLSLTAGDWDVYLSVAMTVNGAGTLANCAAGIGTTSGNISPGNEGVDFVKQQTPTTSNNVSVMLVKRMSLAGPVTVYFKLFATYASGNPQYAGTIWARRRR